MMGRPHLEQEIYHTYLVMDIEEGTDKDKYGIKILQNNILGFFLPFELRSKDGIGRYYYDIPSEESLKKQLEEGISQKQIDAFAASLLGALDEIDEYLMDENDILLEPESIYWSKEDRYLFTYYPGYKGDVPRQLKDVAAAFLKAVDYTSSEAVRRVYEFYHLACNENNSLKKLREYVLEGYKSNVRGELQKEKRAVNDINEEVFHENNNYAKVNENIREISGKEGGSDSGTVQILDKIGNPTPQSHVNREDDEEKLWENKHVRFAAIMGIICLAELGAGGVCLKLFSAVPRLWIMAATLIFIILSVAAGILWSMVRKKREQQEDFWKPEDYVSYSFGGQPNETTILREREPEITLKSANPQLCGHLYISSFPAIIGKEVADNRCRITVPTVSRRHARLEYKGKEFYLTDLHSSNGTFINGELIIPMKPTPVHFGDDIIFSDVEFTFELLEGREQT
ncbi:MAG: FHA domain-containing protein [Clostridiales bacterium]|nr:FHA domain-containing protein [Clostridiales bacterium]